MTAYTVTADRAAAQPSTHYTGTPTTEQLTAAAPELFAALRAVDDDEELLWFWVSVPGIGRDEYLRRSRVIDSIRNAIVKATGAA